MIAAGILIASVTAFVGWIAYRRFQVVSGAWPAVAPGRPTGIDSGARDRTDTSAGGQTDSSANIANAEKSALLLQMESCCKEIESANSAVAARLWKLAFGASSEPQVLVTAHRQVRELIRAKLQVDALDPDYFPRRPTLMPQLLKALDDPQAESEKLSRIIAHDPVLTADVLRLANSSVYRTSSQPIESIQRALVVCGVDALRGILATAMLRPVFRASRTNFPRLPRLLWERTERAARTAELYAMQMIPQDRFEAQLVVLLSALGPLVVYGAGMHAYSRAPRLSPNPALFVDLIGALAPEMSLRIARNWEASPRLLAALDKTPGESLTTALGVGELFATLSLCESQGMLSQQDRLVMLKGTGLPDDFRSTLWDRARANH